MTNSLKMTRHLAGLSQYEVGRRSGISQPLVSNLERGHLRPSQELRLRLADALGVPADVLFPKDGDED